MAGLLSDAWDDPQNQGLLQLGLGLLGSRGSFAQGLSQAGQQAMGVYGASRERQRATKREDERDTQAQTAFQMQQQMAQIQLQQAQAQQQRQQQIQALTQQSARSPQQTAMGANGGPTMDAAAAMPTAQAGFDVPGYIKGLWGIDPDRAIAMQKELRKEAPELKEVQIMRDPASGKMVNVMLFKDGTTKVAPYGARPDIAMTSLGDRMVAVDKNETQAGNIWQMGASPDAKLQSKTSFGVAGMADARARERLTWEQTQTSKPAFHDGAWMTPPTAQNPGGTVTRVQGAEKPLTEVQGNATGFGIKAQNALDNLTELETVTAKDKTLRTIPYGTAEWAMSPNGKRAVNAERQFIAAVLRKESGAVISNDEYATYGNQFFPRLNDPPELLTQKTQNRKSAMLVMRAQAGQEGGRQIDKAVGELRTSRPSADASPPLDAIAAELARRQGGGR